MAAEDKKPLISVIIPVYNMREYIERCVRSVMNQTYSAVEILVVDDGSTDGTGEICDRFALEDARVRVIHKANGGVSSARNAGLAAAAGDYIAWLDADDWYEADMLNALMSAMDEHSAQAALCNYENVHRSGRRTMRYTIDADTPLGRDEAMEWLMTRKITQSLWGNVMPRSVYSGIVFPEGKLFEDVCNVYRLYERLEKIVIVNRLLMNRMYRVESISHDKNVRKRAESFEAYMKRQKDIRQRWPGLDEKFAKSNAGIMLTMRKAVFRSPLREYMQCRAVIRETAAYFRGHTRTVLGPEANPGMRLEYYFLTSGTLCGFYLSRLVALAGGKGTLLRQLK